jgi:hypothetical protein
LVGIPISALTYVKPMAKKKIVQKKYVAITLAGTRVIEGTDIIDAMLRLNHEMGSRGLLGVVEEGTEIRQVLEQAMAA